MPRRAWPSPADPPDRAGRRRRRGRHPRALARRAAGAAPSVRASMSSNVPGAGGNIGTAQAARAAPDGYTLAIVHQGTMTINPHLVQPSRLRRAEGLRTDRARRRWSLGARRQCRLCRRPSVAQLVALAKEQAWATDLRLAGHRDAAAPGRRAVPSAWQAIDLTHVPYRGGAQAVSDLIGGQISMSIEGTNVQLPFVRSGQIACAGGDRPRSARQPARRADRRRSRDCGLRIHRLGRHRGARGDAASRSSIGLHREIAAVLDSRRGARVVRVLRRSSRAASRPTAFAGADARRVCQVGSLDPRGRHQGRLTQSRPAMNERDDHDEASGAWLLEAINASWTTQAIAAAVELRISRAAGRRAACQRGAGARAPAVTQPSLQAPARRAGEPRPGAPHDGDGRFALTASGALLRADVADSLAAWALFSGPACGCECGRGWLTACAAAAAHAQTQRRQRRLRPPRCRPRGGRPVPPRDDRPHAARSPRPSLPASICAGRGAWSMSAAGYGQLIATCCSRVPRRARGAVRSAACDRAAAAPQLAARRREPRCELRPAAASSRRGRQGPTPTCSRACCTTGTTSTA